MVRTSDTAVCRGRYRSSGHSHALRADRTTGSDGERLYSYRQIEGSYERNVIIRHALRNSLIPIVTIAGIQLALLINGTVIIELFFSIRGMGRILVGAIFDKDYPVAQGIILFNPLCL